MFQSCQIELQNSPDFKGMPNKMCLEQLSVAFIALDNESARMHPWSVNPEACLHPNTPRKSVKPFLTHDLGTEELLNLMETHRRPKLLDDLSEISSPKE